MPVHLFVAPFAFVLLVCGAALDLAGMVMPEPRWRRIAGALLIVGAGAALVAFFTGSAAMAQALGSGRVDFQRMDVHTQWGGAGVWALGLLGALRLAWRNELHGAVSWAALAAGLLSAALVTAIAVSGFTLAHAP